MADVSSRAFKHGTFFMAHSSVTSFFNAKIPPHIVHLLEGVPAAEKIDLTSVILRAWRYIKNEITNQTSKVRQKYWR